MKSEECKDPNHPNHKVGGGQNLCFSKKTFFFFFLGDVYIPENFFQ